MQRHEPIEGLLLAQNPYIEEAFKTLLGFGFERVVELGTQNGGFTIFLSRLFKKIITFDNKSIGKTLETFKRFKNIHFIETNIFQNIEYIGSQISNEGKTLLLCDNGNKIKEVAIFTKYLKTGDFIMAHDYAKTREYFKSTMNVSYWHCLEITDADIDFNDLLKIDDERINKSAWFCAIKK